MTTVAGRSVRAGSATHVGLVRRDNEDSVLIADGVFVVADGMGGHAAGEVASELVTSTLGELAGRPGRGLDAVVAAVARANERLLESVREHPERRGMGTTLSGIVVVGDGRQWAVVNVGDSRVYRLLEGRLTQLTVDHSEVRELVDAGVITEAEAARHPLRNVVTRSLGTDPGPVPDTWLLEPQPGERFVACSDGLSNEVGPDLIALLLAEHDDPQAAAEALVEAALEAGGRDNVSVVVVSTHETTAQAGPVGS